MLGRSVELVIQTDLTLEAAAAVQAAETMILTDEVHRPHCASNRSSHAIEVGAVAQSHRRADGLTTAATNPAVTAAGDLVFMAAFTDQFQEARHGVRICRGDPRG